MSKGAKSGISLRQFRDAVQDAEVQRERALFLTLFYRQRISELLTRLRDQKATGHLPKFKSWNLSMDEVIACLQHHNQRAEDESRCNDICKGMYFCDRKKGHKGMHSEDVIRKGDRLLKW